MKQSNRNKRSARCCKQETKERSDLQEIHSQGNHAIYFKLRGFYVHSISKLLPSARTEAAIYRYNIAMRDLRACIKADLAMTKMHILRERKKHLDAK